MVKRSSLNWKIISQIERTITDSFDRHEVNKRPTTLSRNKEIITWLNEHNVNFSDIHQIFCSSKDELLKLIKPLTQNKTFAVYQIIA